MLYMVYHVYVCDSLRRNETRLTVTDFACFHLPSVKFLVYSIDELHAILFALPRDNLR